MQLRSRARTLAREPWLVLVPLVVAQWAAVGIFATVVRHNGWLFYQGGDQLAFYTDAWLLGHGHIPEASIGYGWSFVLTPIAWIFGVNVISALPAIVLFQVVILLPVSLLAVYGIGARVGGRIVGYTAAALWVFLPYAVIPLWDQRYHAKYVEQFLPQALGLTGLGDFPSMVALLVSAYFLVRALDTRAPVEGAVAGLAAGFAIAIKPANAIFLPAAAVGFLLARRWRPGLAFAGALIPFMLTLAVWKYRGLGHLPVITPAPKALALGRDALIAPTPLLASVGDYIKLDWSRLGDNLAQFREFFWSPRAIEWVPIAGVLGVARRSIPKAAFLGLWFLLFFVIKGTSPNQSVEGGTFLRLFMPGFPPYTILAASILLLIPTLGPRLADRRPPATPSLTWRSRPLIALAAVFALAPLLFVLVGSPYNQPDATKFFEQNVYVPVDNGFHVQVTATPGGELIRWKPPRPTGTRVFYVVFRSPTQQTAPDPTLPPGHQGIRCLPPTGGALDCRLEMQDIGRTRGGVWRDPDVLPAGEWTYRIGVAANWIDDQSTGGDVVLVSRPAVIPD
ncbi:MAG: Dolichyl-phosphate-mannose-protein mannosyltransferase [Gaiellaceae bacterium]|jgi:hypothetical protein|nr:Dolichyl-phosphate-mannose-protein mannosyltransferase [Gaiellaceae bacterium]